MLPVGPRDPLRLSKMFYGIKKGGGVKKQGSKTFVQIILLHL